MKIGLEEKHNEVISRVIFRLYKGNTERNRKKVELACAELKKNLMLHQQTMSVTPHVVFKNAEAYLDNHGDFYRLIISNFNQVPLVII